MFKPLDFVKTPKGAIGLITEVNLKEEDSSSNQYSLSFLGDVSKGEKNSWWTDNEGLELIDSLPSLLARNLVHPFGYGKKSALTIFPIK